MIAAGFNDVQQAVVEFPVTVGAQGDEVIKAADDGNQRFGWKAIDRLDMADFHVFVIAAVLADIGPAGFGVFLPGKISNLRTDLIFGRFLNIPNGAL